MFSYNFFQIYHEKPPELSYPYLVQKTSIMSKNDILWAKKVQRMPFFPTFLEKITFSYSYVVKKNHSVKNTLLSSPYFCRKNANPFKNTMLSCHFLQIFDEKTQAVMRVFGQKSFDSIKTKLYYGLKKSIGYPFFQFFTYKSLL